jgi:uncharacterized delta-60 repeat protein
VLGVCVLAPALVGFVAGVAGTAPGSLDSLFGKGGKATIDFGGSDAAYATALRPDGRIVLAGGTSKGTNGTDVAVAQLNPKGTADSSFGVNGHTAADFGGDDGASAVALQPDGKIVVAGSTLKGPANFDFAVARINSKGLFDSSFGVGGEVTVDFGGFDMASAVALRPDGKIIVAGRKSNGTNGTDDFAVAQFNPDGAVDGSFGVGGKSAADFGGEDSAAAVALQPDGKIVVAGSTKKGPASYDFAVARIKPNGYFDNSFGTGGKVTVDFGGDDLAHAVALRPDGKIVVAGYTTKGTNGRDFAVVRINRDGTIDSSFGAGGKTAADFGGDEIGYAVALQADGKIVVAGDTTKGTNFDDFAVARINPNGLYDRSFGAGGRMTVDFGGREGAAAVVLQPGGKIVVGGYTTKGATGQDFAVARLLGGPTGTTLTARIVSATVLGHGQGRTLDVKISVSKAAKVQLRLLKQGSAQLRKTFSVKPGANELKAVLPSTLQKGAYKLEITLRDANGQRKTYRADIAVPA